MAAPNRLVEQRVMAAIRKGELVDLQVGNPADDDPANGKDWGTARTVSAGLLIDLLTREPSSGTERPRAVKIQGARIIGPLDLEGRTLTCPLLLRDCYLDDPVVLAEAVAQTIRLPGCHLPQLCAYQLHTTGNLELGDGFTAHGEVRLSGASIGAELSLAGAHLKNPGGVALNAPLLTVTHSMLCHEGFTVEGEIRLFGAHIDGQLEFTGAHLKNPGGVALDATGLNAGRYMLCDEVTAEGEIQLSGAKIGAQLIFAGANLKNPGGVALNATLLTVGDSMKCIYGFTAEGEIQLSGAKVGAQLAFAGAHLQNSSGRALNADGLTVAHSMLCHEEFTAEGEIWLFGAHIDGQLEFTGARLKNPGGVALQLGDATASSLVFDLAERTEGVVSLCGARIGSLQDTNGTSSAKWDLLGFTYETINFGISVSDRMHWLKHNVGGYNPQMYEQLATAYRRAGATKAARRVNIARQWRSRNKFSPLNWLLYATVGYGYRTWLAAIWLTGLAIVGTRAFATAYTHHLMQGGANPPAFHPAAYTLDLLIPIVDLGQRKAWTPNGWATYWSWALIGVGWVLTTAVVAGLSGILKRD